MKSSLKDAETKAKEKAFELARINGFYRSQVEKTIKAKEQEDKLTMNLRSISSQLKNAHTAYHTMVTLFLFSKEFSKAQTFINAKP